MRPDTEEWIKKADADFLSMTREMNAAKKTSLSSLPSV